MSATWQGAPAPAAARITPLGWLRVVLRGSALGAVTFGGLALLLVVRLVERPLYGLHRPVTPYITQGVCRAAFVILGIAHRTEGTPMAQPGAVVANHASWLDIFALNARKRIYYVAKSEVAGWAGIGWLARATGTVFIARDRAQAAAQKQVFEDRLTAGHKLLFFPEGTSTDGRRVLPFKPTLFEAFFAPALKERIFVQPVSVVYTAPRGQDARFYGWWGDMDFAPHLLKVLAAPCQGEVFLTYHPPLRVADFSGRKSLCAACEIAVRGGHTARLSRSRPPAP
ncbi:1-acyl-sn-glycerol-3-phosphate acyltransferase [Meridianimarinicoccus roseus]|uniref:1-acyl-sn-glycerol-3-phosphate acyltransferase n=1 Tax=Meridianimarinicoccus roseus TaxID=2072018 RepID=A0A2V2LP86_9RHOB|nr:lysophospholipid acyltransferase family protein [Meridianimarinicoccus roseus]PWR04049.1 1-acyl-sn-glycerol-3-phosphate acyltransferase [Meridianimarinicoccus roseus]